MLYDEGFEVTVSGLSLFFFFRYGSSMEPFSSECDATLNGTTAFAE